MARSISGRRSAITVLSVLAALLLVIGPIGSQADTAPPGTLEVTVKDEYGSSLNNATVTVADLNGLVVATGSTIQGLWVTQVPKGNYVVGASKDGYLPASTQAQVRSKKTTKVSLSLTASSSTPPPSPPPSPPPPGTSGPILFASNSVNSYDIFRISPDGSGLVNLTPDTVGLTDFHPSWSPDGKQIAFVSDRVNFIEHIFSMNADGSGVTQLTNYTYSDLDPDWSPVLDDGTTRIAFTRKVTGTNFQIFTVRSDGADARQVTNSSGIKQQPDWSPDGKKLAYACGSGVCIANSGGGSEYVFSNRGRDRNPHWSPDGKFILYDSPDQNGMQKIFVAAVDRSSFKQLTPSNGLYTDREPDWSPGGTEIVLVSDRKFSPQIFRMPASGSNADGSNLTQLTFGAYNIQPDW